MPTAVLRNLQQFSSVHANLMEPLVALQCHSAKQDVTAGALIASSKKTQPRSEQSKASTQVTNVLQRSIFMKLGVKVYILLEVASQGDLYQ